ncbi:hypothetical protein C0995_013032 [Termitomyces sp. Mi166|nr:hypothetical protein C0995_013032 [Termitomyces sp. Mi166\
MSTPSSPTAPSAESNSQNASPIASPSPPKMISPPPTRYKTRTLSQSSAHMRPLSEIIGEKFPPFDHETNIVLPFNNEVGRDSAFEKELGSMLLDAILEMHAWAAARPKHESSLAAQNIEKKIVSVMNTEKEQGMSLSRPRLSSWLFSRIAEVIKKFPDRFQGLAGKRVVIDGTLITQRFHFAQIPHPHRHVQMWYRLARELQEAGVSAVCVFDGKGRHSAKAREIARRQEIQRKVKARGALEIDRSKRLKQLSEVLPRFWNLDDATRKRTADVLSQLAPEAAGSQSAAETDRVPSRTTTTILGGKTNTPPRPQDGMFKPIQDSSPSPSTLRLSVDVDVLMPELVADKTVENDTHLVSDYVDSLSDVEYSPPRIPQYHPWFQEAKAPFYPESYNLSPESEPDVCTTVAPGHIDDLHPHLRIEDLTSSSSTHEPEPASLENAASTAQHTNTHDTTPEPPSSQNDLPPTIPSDIPTQLSHLYLSYRHSVSCLASLSSPTPALPRAGDPDTQAEIVMTKAQYQLTLEEGRFWDAFAAEPRAPKLPDTLQRLSETSEYMSASFERRMNQPTAKTYSESKEILSAMGVPCVETTGAYEAEALASSIVLNGLADYVVSEDTDVLIYEAPLLRNLTNKNTPLTLVSGAEIRAVLQLDRASFVDFALLLGTDFSQRIKNVGPTRALKLIREHGSIERVIELETKYTLPLAPQAYLDQVQVARVVFRTLPPVPEPEMLDQRESDEAKVVEVLQRYGLGKEVMGMEEWDYQAALKGNYFEDNPSAF